MDDDELAFKALADPTRRLLLDRLFVRDGQTLADLVSGIELTRFGVMRHLGVLEEAGLITTRKSGRWKLHFLNPVPIRQIHDRWIGKYAERGAKALVELKRELETEMTETMTTTQVQRVYIKATPKRVWAAITTPEWTTRYGFGGAVEYELHPGGRFTGYTNEGARAMGAPDVAIEGEVLEADAPHRLVQTWHVVMDPSMAAEPPSRVTWELDERPGGMTRLTVTHEFPADSAVAVMMSGGMEDLGAGGGWSWILSGLKTVLETDAPMESPSEQ
jgi:uncharacterized protein YndB with AHSA1/START domain